MTYRLSGVRFSLMCG